MPYVSPVQETSDSLSRDVDQVLCQVRDELMVMATSRITGNITIHCATDGYQVEVNIRHRKIAIGPARKG